MNEIVPSDVLQRLDERHEQLLAELDILNERLELALGAFAKPTSPEPGAGVGTTRLAPLTAGDPSGRSC